MKALKEISKDKSKGEKRYENLKKEKDKIRKREKAKKESYRRILGE